MYLLNNFLKNSMELKKLKIWGSAMPPSNNSMIEFFN